MLVATAFISAVLVAAAFLPVPHVSMRTVALLVFGRSHKVHGPVAGVIFMAMPGPIPGVAGWHMQIYRFEHYVGRLTDNDPGLSIENRGRRSVTKLHLAIDARADFTADGKVDNGSSCMRGLTRKNRCCKYH